MMREWNEGMAETLRQMSELQVVNDSNEFGLLEIAIAASREIERLQAELSDGIAAAFNMNSLRRVGDKPRESLDEQLRVLNETIERLRAERDRAVAALRQLQCAEGNDAWEAATDNANHVLEDYENQAARPGEEG
jgi:uncharacterized small protein (DUF1192 family)